MMTPITPFVPFSPFTLPLAPAASPAMELARAASRGSAKATQALLTALAPRIERVIRAILGAAHQDAEDVLQVAMLGFVEALPAFRGECEPSHFATRIAARTAIAAARRSRTARDRRDDGVDVDALTSRAAQPLDAAVEQRRAEALRELLTKLPAEQAETVALRIVLGWSLPEVAEATGAPINTVRSRIRLAKNALRAMIEADPLLAEELRPSRLPADSAAPANDPQRPLEAARPRGATRTDDEEAA